MRTSPVLALLTLAACASPGDIEEYDAVFADDDPGVVLYRHAHYESEGYCTPAGCADGTRRYGEYTILYSTRVEDDVVTGGEPLVELEGDYTRDMYFVRSRGYVLLTDIDRFSRVDLDGTVRAITLPDGADIRRAVPNRAGTRIAVEPVRPADATQVVQIIDADSFAVLHTIAVDAESPGVTMQWSDDDRLLFYARWAEPGPRTRAFDEAMEALVETEVDRCYVQPTRSGRFTPDDRRKLPFEKAEELPIEVGPAGLPFCFASYER